MYRKQDLRQTLHRLMNELLEENGVEIYGDFKIEVADMDTLAFIKGSKIYVNTKASKYPLYVLKYIIAHEIAHLAVKGHTRKFWETVKHVYPEYEKGKQELLRRLP